MTELLEALTDWILSNLNSMGLLVLGFLLTLFSSWFVARYTWKRQKDDERREKVYAPLYDELSKMRNALGKYGVVETKEYDQISSVHLWYLVPKNLQSQIHQLYNQNLRLVSSLSVTLEQYFKYQILVHINILWEDYGMSFPHPAVIIDPDANGLADDIAISLVEGKMPEGREASMERVFQSLRQKFSIEERTVKELFQRFLEASSKDQSMVELIASREETRGLINAIQNTISTDLETRFWHWLYRRLVSA